MPNPDPLTPMPDIKFPAIAQVVVGLPIEGPFDYLIPSGKRGKIAVGQRVFVSFGHRPLVGVVVGLKTKSSLRQLKSLLSVLDTIPALDENALCLAKRISQYYACSWGEAVETILPEALRKKRELVLTVSPPGSVAPSSGNGLCYDQGQTQRWPWMIEKIKGVLASGGKVIVLVPEVHMIDSVRPRIENCLKAEIAVLDKKLPPAKELEQWQRVREGKAQVVIGTRSAVFAPLEPLRLIMILEEEHGAYKQEQSPFYHAREIARMRAEREGADLFYVSSSPSSEIYREFSLARQTLLVFPAETQAEVQPIDLTNYKYQQPGTISFPLKNSIQEVLLKGGKTVLFFNRRGFATVTRCNQCGLAIKCPRCDVNLVYRYEKKNLRCPLCDQAMELPKFCPQCQGAYLRSLGAGIEKVESEVARVFPQANVALFDRETKNVPAGANIIVATQAVLKVLDEIKPQLVGVLDFDSQFNRSDFRSAEKMFGLLTRFRQAAQQKVVVQTVDPQNYCLQSARRGSYKMFYKKELALRKELGFPPFSHLVALTVRGIKEPDVQEAAKILQERIKAGPLPGVEIFDWQPDYVPKLRDKYRLTIMLKGKNVKKMISWLKPLVRGFKTRHVVVTINVDP